MRSSVLVLAVVAAISVVAGCSSANKSDVAQPKATTHRPSSRTINYRAIGVMLTSAPASYRPPVSRTKVLQLYKSGWPAGPHLRGKPTVKLWTVGQTARGYPAWVITFAHTRPTSYGPRSGPAKADCAFVSIYDLRTRVWTQDFQTCPERTPSRGSCDYGCTPANQPTLYADATAVGKIAGPTYYTGVVVNDLSNSVTVYLAHAPHMILADLNATHPGTYVIHNDAPRSLRAVLKLMRSFDPNLKAQGITISGFGPTQDGYLQVGVTSHVAEAQAKLDAIYGRNIIRVVKQGIAIAF